MESSNNDFYALCYKAKAFFELSFFKESLLYAKQAHMIKSNHHISEIIKISNERIKNEYTNLGLNLNIYTETIKTLNKMNSSCQINLEINREHKGLLKNTSLIDLRQKMKSTVIKF